MTPPRLSTRSATLLRPTRCFCFSAILILSKVFRRRVLDVSLTARRLPPLAAQVSQVGDATPIEREAVDG
jgi:hypothetical protein